MLYVTSRDRSDAFTAYKTLCSDTASDGGLYVPYILPELEAADLHKMSTQTYGETVAQILNIFFSAKLTGWDVDLCIGKNPVKTVPVGRKVIIAEIWRNPSADYAYVVKNIYARLCDGQMDKPTNWVKVAIKIAVLFATYAELVKTEALDSGKIDVAVPQGDMTDPIAAFYAKKMGLPIGNIIMCTDDNSGVWDLLNRGEIGTAPLGSARKLGLERFVEAVCGINEVAKYIAASNKNGLYILPEDMVAAFNDGLFAAVVGKDRVNSVINSIYRNNNYFIDPKTAVCFGGLQDYRAKAGESKLTVMFAEQSPAAYQNEIQKATGLTQEFVSALRKKG